jgi:hypothetical protein
VKCLDSPAVEHPESAAGLKRVRSDVGGMQDYRRGYEMGNISLQPESFFSSFFFSSFLPFRFE